MNQLSALFFPDTRLDKHTACQLLILFERLYYYNPTESPPPSDLDIFVRNNLCEGYCPTPFGDDLPRFQKLLRDVQGSGSEFYKGHLSSLAVGQFRIHDRDEASVWALSSSMSQIADKQGRDDFDQETLWRAVLFLKLAEALMQEEREIAAGLKRIANQRSRLYEALKGGDGAEQETVLPEVAPVTPPPAPISIEQLTKAWGQLFLRDQSTEKKALLATSRPEAADLLIDTYEILARKKPKTLCSLPLPIISAKGEDYLSGRETLHQAASEHLRHISHTIQEIIGRAETDPASLQRPIASLSKELATWPDLIDNYFTGQESSSSLLTIYLFEGISLSRLFSKLCQPDPRETPSATSPCHGMLAVLTA